MAFCSWTELRYEYKKYPNNQHMNRLTIKIDPCSRREVAIRILIG